MLFTINNLLLVLSLALLVSCTVNAGKPATGTHASSDTLTVRNDLGKYFGQCGTKGSITVYDISTGKWIVSDSTDPWKETLPASTFKIVNMLIALETGVITGENDVIKWPGSIDTVKYGYRPDIYHDITVKEAFTESAGWAFIELAKKIGKDRYSRYLDACDYGNGNLSQQDTDFWNFGEFAVSPVSQVKFVKRLYEGKLPFSKKNMDIVKEVMKTEITDNYTIRAKTGWTRDGGMNTG